MDQSSVQPIPVQYETTVFVHGWHASLERIAKYALINCSNFYAKTSELSIGWGQ